jgi:hypothetical protein
MPASAGWAGVNDAVVVVDENGGMITDEVFTISEGCLVNNITLMPSMLTLDERVIRQDYLCDVTERYQIAMEEKFSTDDKPIWAPDNPGSDHRQQEARGKRQEARGKLRMHSP